MNLDFSQYPELKGPIVLLVGGTSGQFRSLQERLWGDLNTEANGGLVPEVIHVGVNSPWWDDPTIELNMHRLLDLFPRKSKSSATKWVETDGFVREVRKILTRLVEQNTSLAELPENWPELVSLAILDVDHETPYVQRIFDGWFPNAMFRAYGDSSNTIAIWREADVTSIAEAHKAREVLDWPLTQLLSRLAPQMLEAYATEMTTTGKVSEIVRLERADFERVMFTPEAIDGLEEALEPYGLKLGMTDAQIDAIRGGVAADHQLVEMLGRTAVRRS